MLDGCFIIKSFSLTHTLSLSLSLSLFLSLSLPLFLSLSLSSLPLSSSLSLKLSQNGSLKRNTSTLSQRLSHTLSQRLSYTLSYTRSFEHSHTACPTRAENGILIRVWNATHTSLICVRNAVHTTVCTALYYSVYKLFTTVCTALYCAYEASRPCDNRRARAAEACRFPPACRPYSEKFDKSVSVGNLAQPPVLTGRACARGPASQPRLLRVAACRAAGVLWRPSATR